MPPKIERLYIMLCTLKSRVRYLWLVAGISTGKVEQIKANQRQMNEMQYKANQNNARLYKSFQLKKMQCKARQATSLQAL